MIRLLICTVGYPRSGKSTWARKQGHPIVNPDAIRLAMHGQRFSAEAEQWVWAMAKTMVSALFLAGHEVVIFDATNGSHKRRDEWKSKNWETQFKVIHENVEVCKARAQETQFLDLLEVIDRMYSTWEPLTMDEVEYKGGVR